MQILQRLFFFITIVFFLFPPAGRLPAALAQPSIVINKGTNQLAFYEDGFLIDVFPVATGRSAGFTPEGSWSVILKSVYPSWRHPDGGPTIPGGVPENPLGPRWLGLNARGTNGNSYGIHGNNNPYSIGAYASNGCVRMYNEDILWLYERVPEGAPVDIIDTDEDLAGRKKYERALVNGAEVKYPDHLGGIGAGGLTYLPARAVAEAMGYRVTWDGENRTIVLANIDHEAQVYCDRRRVVVDGREFAPEEPPSLVEGLTFFPLYYFDHYLGAEVSPEGEGRAVNIRLPLQPELAGLVKHRLAVSVDGRQVRMPEGLSTLSGEKGVLVPLKAVCAAAGVPVSWDETGRCVIIHLPGKKIMVPVNGTPYTVNGVMAGTPGYVIVRNGAAFVSLDFFTEVLNFTAALDSGARKLEFRTAGLILAPFRSSSPWLPVK